MKKISVSLNRFELDDVTDLKIFDKLVLKLLMSLRVSQEYGLYNPAKTNVTSRRNIRILSPATEIFV